MKAKWIDRCKKHMEIWELGFGCGQSVAYQALWSGGASYFVLSAPWRRRSPPQKELLGLRANDYTSVIWGGQLLVQMYWKKAYLKQTDIRKRTAVEHPR